jgi:hypothetical protein
MLKQETNTNAVTVAYSVEVDPDHLIELGHRLKQTAMDNALPNQTLSIPFAPGIVFVYNPEREFTKPVHRSGYVRLGLESAEIGGTA